MLPAFAQTAFDTNPFAYSPYGYNPSLTSYGTPVSSMPHSYYQDSYAKSESDSTPEEKKKDPLSVIIYEQPAVIPITVCLSEKGRAVLLKIQYCVENNERNECDGVQRAHEDHDLILSLFRYLEKRHKNNLAAQKSRKIRRQREESITKTAEILRAENESLKNEIVQLREMIADLRKQLNSSCAAATVPVEPMRESGNIVRDPSYNPYQPFQISFSINSQL
ncbi:hypothetical protein RB195_011702 [Necator americanus]|uniref:BZIP domain-containing protein n=1 Tax=Necator americanus TaxID=51031 RepID=A0ABR1D3L8_NECAM